MNIESLLNRIDEAVSPVSMDESSYRDSVSYELPDDTVANQDRTAGHPPYVAQSIASMTGMPVQTIEAFMAMIKSGNSAVDSATKLGISSSQAMDIKGAMVDIGIYKTPSTISESTSKSEALRKAADFMYRVADLAESDEVAADRAAQILEGFNAMISGDAPIEEAGRSLPANYVGLGLEGDAKLLASTYATAISDSLPIVHPAGYSMQHGAAMGDENSASVAGTVDGVPVMIHVQMDHPEAPNMRFEVPNMDSVATIKLTHHDWMAPLGMAMQMVIRTLLQKHFKYSELESFKA